MAIVHNPHDKIFKNFITDRENAVSLLKNLLPKSIQKYLSLEDIQYEKDSYIPKHLQESFSDLLVSVPVIDREQKAKIYFLFEHKSTHEAKTPLQFLRYIFEIWERYDKISKEKGGKLPIIIPVLITHAKGGWRKKKVSDFIDLPSDYFRDFIPDFDFILFDSVKENPEDYDFAKSLQALLLIWKHFYSPEFIEALQKSFRLMRQAYPEVKLRDFLEPIMNYLYYTRDEEEYIDIYKVAEMELLEGDEYMGTIAEMFERKGAEKKEQEFLQKKNLWISEAKSEGKVEGYQETLITAAQNRFGIVKPKLAEKIRKIRSIETLHSLFSQIFIVDDKNEFEKLVEEALEE